MTGDDDTSPGEGCDLLFALGLCGVARSWRLLAFFWCVTLSFTFAQPYAWEATILSCFMVSIALSFRSFHLL